MPTLHAVSGCWAMLMSSAWPPSPASPGAVPELGELEASCEEPLTVVPAMLPEAISWRTSSAVIGHGVPSTRLQSLEASIFAPPTPVQVPYSDAPHAFSAALQTRPATPALLPVASDEDDVVGTGSSRREP